ncbi:hypothetical protein [Prochlorococcus marinus]|nr:hypothetical protein [Prochlorococcus marinus]
MNTDSQLNKISHLFDNLKKNDDVDLMADVDDQRAHHFCAREDFEDLDEYS